MSQLKEVDVLRRISLLSVLSNRYDEKRKSLPPNTSKVPKDDFYIVHITMFLIGFMSLMPMTFFSVANDYWMFKFRNTSSDSTTSDGEDRTTLQQYFQSMMIVVQTVPSAILATSTMTYRKYAQERTMASLIALTLVFTIFTIFTKIDTDSWQTGFFILSMSLLLLVNLFLSAFQSASLLLVARLPPDYLFYYMIGQNGTILTTILQIISLTVTNTSSTAGLTYFIAGTLFILLTLVLSVLMIRSKVFKYYVTVTGEEYETVTYADMRKLIKIIWPSQLMLGIYICNICFINPALMTLVVPQQGQQYNEWTSKYFIPVTVFLLFDIFNILGKFATRKLVLTRTNKWWHISFSIICTFILVPFYLFCNAHPRTLPVVFDQDWQFIVMNILYAIFGGYAINIAFMSLKTLSNDQEDAAFSMINVTACVMGMIFCGNGLLAVKLLTINS